MKKKLLLILSMVAILTCIFAISVSAEVTIYDDAPARSNIQIKEDEIIEFNDGFRCLSAYVFNDVTSIGNNGSFEGVMDFTYISGKTGKTYTYADVKGFDIPSGFTYIGLYAGSDAKAPTWVTFPNTVTSLGNAIFQNSTTLEKCVLKFDENHPITNFPAYMFYGCKKLTAFSMPDCFTAIYDIAHFTNCSSLTAVYLSKNLTKWQSQGGSFPGTFDHCSNMYFVNEPFTYDSIPAKPDVYYFPTGLTTNAEDKMDFSNQCPMRNCSSINSTVVFGTNVTRFNNAYFLQGVKVNIVFLGDMDVVAMGNGNWYQTTNYFANSADKSTDDVEISTYSTSKAVFCHAEGNTSHLAEKTVDVPAQCEIDAGKATYCFCGYEISKEAVEGTALSHNYDYLSGNATLVSISYTSYLANGAKVVTCANCGENGELVASALFICLGYSAPEDGSGGIAIGYTVNNEAIQAYTKATGKTLKYGIFAVLKDRLGTNDVFAADGTAAEGVINAEISNYSFVAFALKIIGFETDTQKSAKLAMGAYVAVSDGETTKYSYMQYGTPEGNEKYCFVSYNDIVSTNSNEDEAVAQ